MLIFKVDSVDQLKKKQWSIADGKSLRDTPKIGSTLVHYPSGIQCSVAQVGLIATGGSLGQKKRSALARLSSWAITPLLSSLKAGDYFHSPNMGFRKCQYAVEVEHIREADLGTSGLEIVVHTPEPSTSAGLLTINPDLRSGTLEWLGESSSFEERQTLSLWVPERVFGDSPAYKVRVIRQASHE